MYADDDGSNRDSEPFGCVECGRDSVGNGSHRVVYSCRCGDVGKKVVRLTGLLDVIVFDDEVIPLVYLPISTCFTVEAVTDNEKLLEPFTALRTLFRNLVVHKTTSFP